MDMKRSIFVIGMDAASRPLLETWIEQGHLPALAAIRQRSSRARLQGVDIYRAETPWTCFLTGCEPEQTGYWTFVRFDPADYRVEDVGAYPFTEYPPFYALGDSHRVAAIDVPQSRPVDTVNGVQVIAWGAHSPMAPAASRPAELLGEIQGRFGRHPALLHDEATLWRLREMERLELNLRVGIGRRTEICEDLIRKKPWDLFLTAFGETHAAGHYLWHRSQADHPWYGAFGSGDGDPLLRIHREVDRAIGRIEASLPAGAYLVVFSAEGMEANCMDLPSTVFLPELLYRRSFPGSLGLGVCTSAPGQLHWPSRSWVPAVWSTQGGVSGLRRMLRCRLPSLLSYRLDRLWPQSATDLLRPSEAGDLGYQPTMWYQHLWPRMQAFALPSFSEGYVRINMKGREAEGSYRSAALSPCRRSHGRGLRLVRRPGHRRRSAAARRAAHKPGADPVGDARRADSGIHEAAPASLKSLP
jgi:hypothetical protein